jgi:hypothetical protein
MRVVFGCAKQLCPVLTQPDRRDLSEMRSDSPDAESRNDVPYPDCRVLGARDEQVAQRVEDDVRRTQRVTSKRFEQTGCLEIVQSYDLVIASCRDVGLSAKGQNNKTPRACRRDGPTSPGCRQTLYMSPLFSPNVATQRSSALGLHSLTSRSAAPLTIRSPRALESKSQTRPVWPSRTSRHRPVDVSHIRNV